MWTPEEEAEEKAKGERRKVKEEEKAENGGKAKDAIPLHARAAHEIVRLGIAHVPEGRQIFADMTVRENIILGAYARRIPHKHAPPAMISHQETPAAPPPAQVAALPDTVPAGGYELYDIYDAFPVLGQRRHQKAGTLSGGEQQMLAIGRALMAHPRLLLLDEPSLGLAPLIVRQIFDIIRRINKNGTTIFLVEQNARMALTVANQGYVLQTGSVIKSDEAARLLKDPEVQKAYLGG